MTKTIKEQLPVVGVLLGAVLLDYGLSLAWHPLGFISGGLELASISFFVAYASRGAKG